MKIKARVTRMQIGAFARDLSMDRLIDHLRQPLYRNAYAWMFSMGISSALGIVYWILAARIYAPDAVGINAAAISVMVFLAVASQFDLMNAVTRFLPVAGKRTRFFVIASYLFSGGMIALIGALVLLLFHLAAPFVGTVRADALAASRELGIWFILSTMIWSIFSLQDGVLTGLRDATWVPVENTLYAVAKIGLLILFADAFPRYGIFASWILPVVVAILPINWLIFRRLIPRQMAAGGTGAETFTLRTVTRYIMGNYIGSLFFQAVMRLLPLLVLSVAGASAAGYFYLPWTIITALRLIVMHMAMSLTVEGAQDDSQLHQTAQKFLTHVLMLVAPVVLLLLVGAPLFLRFSGEAYAANGTRLFQVLMLSIFPSMVILLYLSVARVRHHLRGIVLSQGVASVLTLGLSYLLLSTHGILGVGVAVLVGEGLVALVLIVSQLAGRRNEEYHVQEA